VSAGLRRTFASLAVPNYRRYFGGQVVSLSGNWMQNIAEMWLIVQLTHNGALVGVTAALQFVPMLLFGAWGGVLADRMDKRRLLMCTQAAMAIPAAALWALTVHGTVETWMVWAVVLTRGSVNALDNPARQAFVMELVGSDRVVNAVALNSVIVHTARIVGPALAGTVIALIGVGPCFGVNALSFGAMLLALRTMDPALLNNPRRAARERGQLRAAVAHVRSLPELWVPLGAMVIVGTLSYNFQVLLPLLASQTWHGTATTYALLTTAMGVGSVMGALAAGARNRVSPRLLVGAATLFGVVELAAAVAPVLPLQIATLIPLGAVSVTFAAGVNSTLQLASDPLLRGRVMALYSVVFLGSTPIGAPLVGWLAEAAGPRAGLVLGGTAALVAAIGARVAFARTQAATDEAAAAPSSSAVSRRIALSFSRRSHAPRIGARGRAARGRASMTSSKRTRVAPEPSGSRK
jgi:MFS family permease